MKTDTKTPKTTPLTTLAACFDHFKTHDTESLKNLKGVFYKMGSEDWCDTVTKSWRKEGNNLWVCRS